MMACRVKRSSRGTGKAGLALIEIMIGITILSVFMRSIYQVQTNAQRLADRAAHEDKVQAQLTRTLGRVSSELRGVIDISIWEDLSNPGLSSEVLTFKRIESLTNGVAQASASMRFRLALDVGEIRDGIDNDGDGLVDEGMVKLTRDPGGPGEMAVILCHNVTAYFEGEELNLLDDNDNGLDDELGFHIQRKGQQLIVRLSIEDKDARGDSIIKSAEETIRIRN